MDLTRDEREAVFQDAKAGVLALRPLLATGVRVVLLEREESFAVEYGGYVEEARVGAVEAQFLRLVDGQRTVGEIIETIADDMVVTEAVVAGKAAMAALHGFYLDGVISELR